MCSRRRNRAGMERWAASRILLLPRPASTRDTTTTERLRDRAARVNGERRSTAVRFDCFQPPKQWLARFWHSQRYSVNTNNWGTKSQKHFTEFQSVVNTGTCDAVITACNCPQLFFKGKNQRGTKYLPQVFAFVLFSEIFGWWVEPCHHHNTS